MGDRDSEIAALIEDQVLVESQLNAETVLVSKLAKDLRMKLMREHLGLGEDDMSPSDVFSEEFYNQVWKKTSQSNTHIYKQIFHKSLHTKVIPIVKNKVWKKGRLRENDLSMLKEIRGHLVNFDEDCFAAFPPKPTIFEKYFPKFFS